MTTMTFSLQLFTLRSPIDDDLDSTLEKAAAAGFTQVEPYNFVATAGSLGRAMQELGLTAPSGHAPLLRSDQDEIFRAANALGIATVIDPHVPEELWQQKSDIEATAGRLNAAARKAADYGIRVGYHNHAFELESRIDGRSALEYFADQLDPAVVLEVDTYWAAVGGEDPAQLLTTLGERVRFIHLKDGDISKDRKAQLPAGRGRMPIAEILAAATSVEVGVVEFDDYAGDIFEGIRESLDFLTSAGPTGEDQAHAAAGDTGPQATRS